MLPSEEGVHHRVLDEVRHPLVIVDRRVALLAPGGLDATSRQAGALAVERGWFRGRRGTR